MPSEAKNIAAKMSRSGMTSWSARCPVQSETLMARPAPNAPRAAESPMDCVTAADPTLMATTVTMNDSRVPKPAARRNSQGITRPPTRNTAPSTNAAFNVPKPMSASTELLSPASAGTTAIIGTNAKSCITNMPVITRPWSVCTSPRSVSVLSTTIVLLKEITKLKMTACSTDHPSERPRRKPAPPVMISWPRPARIRRGPRRRRSAGEISTPTANSRSTTPSSASVCTASTLLIKPKA